MLSCFAALLFSVFAMPSLATVEPAALQKSEDDKLAAFFKSYLDTELRMRPLKATYLGDHRFDHLLDDVSPKARKTWKKLTRDTLSRLKKEIDTKKLTRAGQIDYEILANYLKRSLWLSENTNRFEDDPRVYNQYITDSVFALLTQSTQPQPVNVRNCAERIRQIPKIIAAAKESLKRPPKVVVETAIKQNRGAISFYQQGVFQLAGETPQLSTLRDVSKVAVKHLKDYQNFLENDLLKRSKGDWRLGKRKFDQKLQMVLDAGVTADEVFRDAQAEFKRVTDEMYVVARQLWHEVHPGKALPPADDEGRRETIKLVLDKVNGEHGKADDLVKDARAGVGRIKSFIAKNNILTLPKPDRCKIIEMPEFQRGNSIAYLNPAPPLDPKAASHYAISPPPSSWTSARVESFLREYNKHMLQMLSIHEAYPGHYVQLEYSNRNPSLIRKVLYSGVFAEGWAVYTEQMMLDQGYGDGNLKLRLSQLKWYLRAVANAILDYKMHCANMTDEQALFLLMVLSYQSEGEAILKVIRSKQSSCQLSTYFVGRMAFVRLREKVQRKLGRKFDLGKFHEETLSHGTLPVKYLPELLGVAAKQ